MGTAFVADCRGEGWKAPNGKNSSIATGTVHHGKLRWQSVLLFVTVICASLWSIAGGLPERRDVMLAGASVTRLKRVPLQDSIMLMGDWISSDTDMAVL